MKLDFRKEDQKLTVLISGNIDTVTAPDLEKELKATLDDVEVLILDMTAVGYISSAGLRVVMGTDKQMRKQGRMVLKNVSSLVKEVFEITGFGDFLNFE